MLSRIAGKKSAAQESRLICAPHEADSALQDKVRELRAQGERVVFCYDGQLPDAGDESIARLVKKNGSWVVD